jgi:hypothetical protein
MRQNLIDPLWQNKNAPLKVIAFRGLFVFLRSVLTGGLTQKIHFT